MTKIVGTLGPNSICTSYFCLFDGWNVWYGWLLSNSPFVSSGPDYHQETLENLKIAVKSTKKLCAVMLDTAGPEVLVTKVRNLSLSGRWVCCSNTQSRTRGIFELLPTNYGGLSKVGKYYKTSYYLWNILDHAKSTAKQGKSVALKFRKTFYELKFYFKLILKSPVYF
ncbi:hypothetical protein IC575_031106 [Cucumis melo]